MGHIGPVGLMCPIGAMGKTMSCSRFVFTKTGVVSVNRLHCSIIVISALMLLNCAGCRNGNKGKPGGEVETPRVHVVKPAVKTLTFAINRPGHIDAFEQTPLFSKVEGYVGK